MTQRHDVLVVGGGLAGLSCARDLAAAGVDVCVLEARGRPGGRVEQQALADGRLVQLGGEVVGPGATAYAALVAELGLTLEPAFPDLPGESTWVLADRVLVGDDVPWFTDGDRRSYDLAEAAFGALAATVDPDDPWSHPEAVRLDRLSVGDFLREQGATPGAIRERELASLALGCESVERTSLLSDLRKEAAVGSAGFYSYDTWECLRVAEGSATVALRLAERARSPGPPRGGCPPDRRLARLGARSGCTRVNVWMPLRSCAPCRWGRCATWRSTGSPLSGCVRSTGNGMPAAAKAVFVYDHAFWQDQGQDGAIYFEREVLGGTWAQQSGVLSALVPPERLGAFEATSPRLIEGDLTAEMARALGPRGGEPAQVFLRRWHSDRWTQGYITGWRPGDVMGVGPLHGTHAPPFYVCGSDQWVCGYMEGAVRTGRAAAAALLAPTHP